ncbi:hypothetical protein CS542_02100 [Pedobacter sp. IW39]|nr:hypothetical protein CS542_02100 [Pedobacter sp. IW39]
MFAAYGNNGTPDLAIMQQVTDLCKQLMSQYKLSKNFEDIFRDATQKVIRKYIYGELPRSNNTAAWDLYYESWDAAAPLSNLVNTYECTDGLPYGTSPLTNTAAPFTDRDPRLTKRFKDFVDFGNGKVHHPSNQDLLVEGD